MLAIGIHVICSFIIRIIVTWHLHVFQSGNIIDIHIPHFFIAINIHVNVRYMHGIHDICVSCPISMRCNPFLVPAFIYELLICTRSLSFQFLWTVTTWYSSRHQILFLWRQKLLPSTRWPRLPTLLSPLYFARGGVLPGPGGEFVDEIVSRLDELFDGDLSCFAECGGSCCDGSNVLADVGEGGIQSTHQGKEI